MTRAPETDVVVVGAGIAGLTAALALAERGARVLVLDTPRPGAASRASAGMLAGGFGFSAALAPLAVAARERYPAFLGSAREATGIAVPLDRRGIIELAGDEAGVERIHQAAPDDAERLGARALASLEPALAGHAGGVLHPNDGAVDVATLMAALDRWADLHPRIARRWATVVGIDAREGEASALAGDGTRHTAAHVVLAAGAWVSQLALPQPVPVRPVHGELMLVAGAPLGHVAYGGGGYLIPRGDRTLVGATSEEVGHAVRVTPAGRDTLLGIAARLVPGLALAEVREHWAGLRPVSPDGLPVIGPDARYPALLHACGYSRNGILFAPWAAEALARLVAGEPVPELAPFSMTRFGGG